MKYDINVMTRDKEGNITYRFPSLSGRIVGKEKLAQWFIRTLYDNNGGGLLSIIRSSVSWGESDIRMAIVNTTNKIKEFQRGTNPHPDELLIGVSVKLLDIRRKDGIVDIKLVLLTPSGEAPLSI